ncbi:MAG TPA: hypothetical protein VFZ13_07710 [Gemmatimonadales bacterium]
MSRASSLAMALSAALALGACAGEGGLPTSEAPEFQAAGIGPACNLTDLRKATSALFGSRDPANDIAKKFTSKNQNTAAVTEFAYQLFGAIEARRESGPWASLDPEKGAELTLQIIACSLVRYSDTSLEGTNTANAKAALMASLDVPGAGTYAVGAGKSAATSKNNAAGLGAATGNLETLFGGPVLIIGYAITPASFTTENDDANVYYDWAMVRPAISSGALNGLANISYCVGDLFNDDELRIQHLPSNADGTILPLGDDVPGVGCVFGQSLRPAASPTFAARLLEGLFDAIRPDPLFAGAVLKGPVSGTIGGFSPTGVVDPDSTVISFIVLPPGGTTNTDLPLQVRVTGKGGTPWQGVTVEITASENNGTTLSPCGTTAVTNDDGLAIFEHFQINKPGTVHLTATTIETPEGIATSYDEVSIESTSFVITGAGNQGCTEPE